MEKLAFPGRVCYSMCMKKLPVLLVFALVMLPFAAQAQVRMPTSSSRAMPAQSSRLANHYHAPASRWHQPVGNWRPQTGNWRPHTSRWQPPAGNWQAPSARSWRPPAGNWRPPSSNPWYSR